MKTLTIVVLCLSLCTHGYRLTTGRYYEKPPKPNSLRRWTLLNIVVEIAILLWVAKQ